MAQATDIVLNNAGYMVEPGSPQSPGYKRLQDGYPEGLTQRTSITDFFGGQGRTHQLERDTFYDSLNVGPALGGQGVMPWARSDYTSGTSNTPAFDTPTHRDTPMPHVIARGRLYIAVGKKLYRGPSTDATTRSWTVAHTFTSDITDITIYGSDGLLVAFGSADDITYYGTKTGATAALFPGERAHKIEGYAGYALWIDARNPPDTPTIIRMVTGTDIQYRHVTHDAFAMALVDGEVMLITRQALYKFGGRVADVMVPNPGWTADGTGGTPTMPGQEWTGEFEPFFQQGVYTEDNDFRFIAGYGGRTIAWIAGGMHELVPSGDRAGWRSIGLDGIECFGGCVSAGYAVVSIHSHSGMNELWAYDGNGWWCIGRQAMDVATGIWINPIDVGRETRGHSLYVWHEGTDNFTAYQLRKQRGFSGVFYHHYAGYGEFVTPLIDAGDRDKIKAWRKIGAVFSSPERQGRLTSADPIAVRLDYSTDAGDTWIEGTQANGTYQRHDGNTLAHMNFDLEGVLSGVTSRFIMLRVVWLLVISDWAPILTGLWVEHEALSSPARRRKWQLRIHARDQEVDRDGVVLTRTGRQLIEELWSAWESDTPLPFRDIDYDDDPTERTVRIVGISEAAVHPFDHGEWGDSTITLSLVEI